MPLLLLPQTLNKGFFTDFTTDTGIFQSGSNPNITGGSMVVTPTTSFLRRRTAISWDLTGQSWEFPVANVFDGTVASASMWMQLRINTATDAERVQWGFSVSGGVVQLVAARYNNTNTLTTMATLTYNSSTHAWVRIREDTGTLYWDYSSDGLNWTNAASVAVATWGFGVTAFFPDIGSGLSSGTASSNPSITQMYLGAPTVGSIPGTATLTGAATLTANAVLGAGSTPTGAATLTAVATQIIQGTATLTGAATTTATVVQRASVAATGAATLTALVTQGSTVSATGAATVTAAATTSGSATATLTAAATLTANATVTVPGSASLTGAAALTATPKVLVPGTATATAAATLTASATVVVPGVATLTGSASLTAVGTEIGGGVSGTASLVADSTLLATATVLVLTGYLVDLTESIHMTRLWNITRGYSAWRIGGVWTFGHTPDDKDLAGNDLYIRGGYNTVVDATAAAQLQALGITVTPVYA